MKLFQIRGLPRPRLLFTFDPIAPRDGRDLYLFADGTFDGKTPAKVSKVSVTVSSYRRSRVHSVWFVRDRWTDIELLKKYNLRSR